MGALAGGAAATLGGSYLQNRANNKATEKQNQLIEQQAQQNNVMAMMYLQEHARLTADFNAKGPKAEDSARRAAKAIISTLPMPKTSTGTTMGNGFNGVGGYSGAPIGGRQMLLGA